MIGEIFLFMFLQVGDTQYEPEVHVADNPTQCLELRDQAMLQAQMIANFVAREGLEVRAVAECVDADTLADRYGIKAI
jgi:hypothetical protein